MPDPGFGLAVWSAFPPRTLPTEDRLLRAGVGSDGDALRRLLARTQPADLTPEALRSEVQGNLGMLAPRTFACFLPAFMLSAVSHYAELRDFAAELVGALTEPSRADLERALDYTGSIPTSMGLPAEAMRELRRQQLAWFDSGEPTALYQARLAELSGAQRAAVMLFLRAIESEHSEDFPFGELDAAIGRLHGQRGG